MFTSGPSILNCIQLMRAHVTPSAPKVGHESAGNSLIYVQWEGLKKTLGTSLQPFPFRFVMELFEGFAIAVISRRGSPPPPFLPCLKPWGWRESEGQLHLHFLWANLSHANDC